ncbi:MAG: hypothetical protein H6581_28700 [Bacteroidia bacterium]|nr:hypothetical protein [Bacteroidia bacterium]
MIRITSLLALLSLVVLPLVTRAQLTTISPNYISVSYFGETITHPGLRVNADYVFWKKGGDGASSQEIRGDFGFGMYHHRRYQTGLFFLPEFDYIYTSAKGSLLGAGLSLGYLHTFIPSAYEIDANGNVNKINAGYNYFLTGLHLIFGKTLGPDPATAPQLFFKPALLTALPNFEKTVNYFVLEVGVSIPLKN